MRKQEEKQKSLFRKKLLAVALGLLFLILLIVSFFGKNGLIEMYRAKEKHQVLILEIERLEKIKQKLERDIAELGNNPKAVDQKAREKLWLMKPDEIVIIKKEK